LGSYTGGTLAVFFSGPSVRTHAYVKTTTIPNARPFWQYFQIDKSLLLLTTSHHMYAYMRYAASHTRARAVVTAVAQTVLLKDNAIIVIIIYNDIHTRTAGGVGVSRLRTRISNQGRWILLLNDCWSGTI